MLRKCCRTFGHASLLALIAISAGHAQSDTRRASDKDALQADAFAIPASTSFLDEALIRSAGVKRPSDFVSLVPNMTLIETQNQGTALITVRGIGQARHTHFPVAIVIDGVPLLQPAQFNRELLDIQSIQVIRGPQGALFGPDALAGAIVIKTEDPSNEPEVQLQGGSVHSGGWEARLVSSGPLGGHGINLKYRAAIGYIGTNGGIVNSFRHEKADPYRDASTRLRLVWEPTVRLSIDSKLYASKTATRAYYFNATSDVNNASLPVRVNNPGKDNRKLAEMAIGVHYETALGTFSSITSYGTTEEITTGDEFNFLPITESFVFGLSGFFDLGKSQFLDANSLSEEVRFTSTDSSALRWFTGIQYTQTEQFTSSGQTIDFGAGVFPVYRTPSSNFLSPQFSFVADDHRNLGWSSYGGVTVTPTPNLEASIALRYSEDRREQTTRTPQAFLDRITIPGDTRSPGDARVQSWDEVQPHVALRYTLSDSFMLYGSYNKGFRGGGFNQVGVGSLATAQGVTGLRDSFQAETAESLEFGLKSRHYDGRLTSSISVFRTRARKTQYFFFFVSDYATRNVGNLDEVQYRGFEFEVNSHIGTHLNIFAAYGATDSEIVAAPNPNYLGNQAPLVSKSTSNFGVEYRLTMGRPLGGSGLDLILRADYRRIGDTYWGPENRSVRDPVNLVSLRIGIGGPTWSMIAWTRNANDVQYNAEYLPGNVVFKGQPRRWGVEFTRSF